MYLVMASTTLGVATLGFEPPIRPALLLPVSKNLREAKSQIIRLVQCSYNSPINARNRRHSFLITNAVSKQSFSDLPSKHCWILFFVSCNSINDIWSSNFGLRTTDYSWSYRTRFIKPVKQYLVSN